MILANDLGEALRPQPVGQRPRRLVLETCGHRSSYCPTGFSVIIQRSEAVRDVAFTGACSISIVLHLCGFDHDADALTKHPQRRVDLTDSTLMKRVAKPPHRLLVGAELPRQRNIRDSG